MPERAKELKRRRRRRFKRLRRKRQLYTAHRFAPRPLAEHRPAFDAVFEDRAVVEAGGHLPPQRDVRRFDLADGVRLRAQRVVYLGDDFLIVWAQPLAVAGGAVPARVRAIVNKAVAALTAGRCTQPVKADAAEGVLRLFYRVAKGGAEWSR